jgi:hypothetical protein
VGLAAGDLLKVKMNAEMVTQIIQAILAPVLMVNACALLVAALFTRYVGINDRLRQMAHERLVLLRDYQQERSTERFLLDERLQEIDAQFRNLLRRHWLAHHAVIAMYAAIGVFVIDMFVIAVSLMSNDEWTSMLALVVFLAGIALMPVGIVLTVVEVSTSRGIIVYEVTRAMKLHPDDMTPINQGETHGTF